VSAATSAHRARSGASGRRAAARCGQSQARLAEARLIVEAMVPEGGHIEAREPAEPFLIPTVMEITPAPPPITESAEARFPIGA